jgi:hypothetical protein
VGHRAQHVVERGAGGGQDHLDALERVAGLLADVLADLAGGRVPAGLAGHEDQVAELGGQRQVRIGPLDGDAHDLLLHSTASTR